MSEHTNIEWTNATWNFLRGCTRVSKGCEHCYAETTAHRFNGVGMPYEGLTVINAASGKPRWSGEIMFVEQHLYDPIRWQKPRKIFVNSMSDVFHEGVSDEILDKMFAVMAMCPRHTFQILTKRPERMLRYMTDPLLVARISYQLGMMSSGSKFDSKPFGFKYTAEAVSRMEHGGGWPLPNVWLGVSCEDQKTADERIPLLLQTPSAIRWISAEPLLGPIVFDLWQITGFDTSNLDNKLDWVVVGGESGPDARPMHPDWVRQLRNQCQLANVPFFFKQWGAYRSDIDAHSQLLPSLWMHRDGRICRNEEDARWAGGEWLALYHLGKKDSGHELDRTIYQEYPSVRVPSAS